MEVNHILMSLCVYGRIFCALDAEEALAVAEKAMALAMEDGETDPVDLIDMYDDVWAASLLAGTIHEGDDIIPVHPLSEREHQANFAPTAEAREEILSQPDKVFEPVPKKRPKRYKNKKYVAVKKTRRKKRHYWDKEG
jgi:hypothetical protein